MRKQSEKSVVIAGGGIGGLAAALAISNKGYRVTVLEQAPQFGEIGAGIQLGPNAFHALDRLGVGEATRASAVFIDQLTLMDSLTEKPFAQIPVGEQFRKRFGNPYVVIHRADIHTPLLEACRRSDKVTLLTNQRVVSFDEMDGRVTVLAADGTKHEADALIGADGLRSRIRESVVGDAAPLLSGHICFRAVLPIEDMPEDLRWNRMTIWCGPGTHFVHYPLRGGKLFNLVATFVGEPTPVATGHGQPGDRNELLFRFREVGPTPRKIMERPKTWTRWVLGDREPVTNWSRGPVTLLGDAAHPMHQYFAQGACMALEDAVCLADKIAAADGDFAKAFIDYQNARILRTGQVVLGARFIGDKIFHPRGVEAQIRNAILSPKTPEQFYDMLDWLYGGPPEYRRAAPARRSAA
ncbi:MAG TPA: 3-hydroxybenzoate 6-monooxygenase [Alphaproteobacteria bacterium]